MSPELRFAIRSGLFFSGLYTVAFGIVLLAVYMRGPLLGIFLFPISWPGIFLLELFLGRELNPFLGTLLTFSLCLGFGLIGGYVVARSATPPSFQLQPDS